MSGTILIYFAVLLGVAGAVFVAASVVKRPVEMSGRSLDEESAVHSSGGFPADDDLPAIYEENTFCEAACDDADLEAAPSQSHDNDIVSEMSSVGGLDGSSVASVSADKQSVPVVENNTYPATEPDAVFAVLYEDASGNINYDDVQATIDPNIERYKDFKRVGRGVVELSLNAINFYFAKKLFRYDFKHIEFIRFSSQVAAIVLKGTPVVKVFIFEGDDRFLRNLKDQFTAFARS